jgi:regulatory protein
VFYKGICQMGKITGIKAVRGREKRIKVFLDGEEKLGLLTETAMKAGLKKGQKITDSRLAALAEEDRFQRCLKAAIHLLGYRPRSEAEIKQRLLRRGFEPACLEKAINRLKEQGLVDDAAFARFWRENRDTFSPRSRRLTQLELKRKGLSSHIIEEIINDIDDADSAYRAASSRARRLITSDYQDFRQRLGGYLGRRGFNYGIIKEITERVWKEQKTSTSRK